MTRPELESRGTPGLSLPASPLRGILTLHPAVRAQEPAGQAPAGERLRRGPPWAPSHWSPQSTGQACLCEQEKGALRRAPRPRWSPPHLALTWPPLCPVPGRWA